MYRLLPLVFLLAACGDDAPDPAVESDTDIAVVDAALDTLATEDERMNTLVDEQVDDAAVVVEPSPDADVPSPATPPVTTPDPAPAAPARNVLVDGTTGGDGTTVDADGHESYDMTEPPLADVFAGTYFNIRGTDRGTLLVERGDSATRGTYTRSEAEREDETGIWTLEGGTLTLGGVRYTITARQPDGLTFSGPDGDLRLINTAG